MNEGPGPYNAGRGAQLPSANLSTGGPKLGWPAPVRAVVRLFLLAEGFARAAVLGWMAWTGTEILAVHIWGIAGLAWISAMVVATSRWRMGAPSLPTLGEKSSLALHYLFIAAMGFALVHSGLLEAISDSLDLSSASSGIETLPDSLAAAHVHLLLHSWVVLWYGQFIQVMDHRAELEF